jgi:hypothetical protein
MFFDVSDFIEMTGVDNSKKQHCEHKIKYLCPNKETPIVTNKKENQITYISTTNH